MFLRINEDQKAEIIISELNSVIESYEEDIAEMDDTKKGTGNYSWDYKEDRKETKKLLKALRKVKSYYVC